MEPTALSATKARWGGRKEKRELRRAPGKPYRQLFLNKEDILQHELCQLEQLDKVGVNVHLFSLQVAKRDITARDDRGAS